MSSRITRSSLSSSLLLSSSPQIMSVTSNTRNQKQKQKAKENENIFNVIIDGCVNTDIGISRRVTRSCSRSPLIISHPLSHSHSHHIIDNDTLTLDPSISSISSTRKRKIPIDFQNLTEESQQNQTQNMKGKKVHTSNPQYIGNKSKQFNSDNPTINKSTDVTIEEYDSSSNKTFIRSPQSFSHNHKQKYHQ